MEVNVVLRCSRVMIFCALTPIIANLINTITENNLNVIFKGHYYLSIGLQSLQVVYRSSFTNKQKLQICKARKLIALRDCKSEVP